MKKDSIDILLNIRKSPKADAGLAERIAHAALYIPQKTAPSFWKWLEQLFGEFNLPSPAYSLASLLLLSLLVGFQSPLAENDENSINEEVAIISMLHDANSFINIE